MAIRVSYRIFCLGGKLKFRNCLNDTNLKRLMRIAIEGLEMKSVDFDEILIVFKE